MDTGCQKVSAFMDTYPTKKVSSFMDTNLQKKVSAFMDTFLFYHSFLFVNALWKVWALCPQFAFHFFMLLKAISQNFLFD